MNTLKIIKFFIVFFIGVSSAYASLCESTSSGGPCEYKRYKGDAKIISITQKDKAHNDSHETYEVKFVFNSDQEIKHDFVRTNGKEFVLLLNNSNYPGPKFLKKYGIAIGQIFECHLKVITKGTCAPLIFEFPSFSLDDYNEN